MVNQVGIAIAMSLANPTLGDVENFGIAINWGSFQSSNALGISFTGLIFKDVLGEGKGRIAVSGGVGTSIGSLSVGKRRINSQVGGRAGIQFTW